MKPGPVCSHTEAQPSLLLHLGGSSSHTLMEQYLRWPQPCPESTEQTPKSEQLSSGGARSGNPEIKPCLLRNVPPH